ncbi:MAG: BREX system ATP-binding domain-containing protein [Candidatus Dormibacteria bacterium]
MSQGPRRAIEALRAGVPNRDAVQEMGTDQPAIEHHFHQTLGQIAGTALEGRQLPGMVVAGDFGSGKSHLLEYLQHLALDQRFACSKVVISKEAPLAQPHQLYRTAIHSLRLPNGIGGLDALVLQLDKRSGPYAAAARRIVTDEASFDPLFQASFRVWEEVNDPPIMENMVAFWRGERLGIRDLRDALRRTGIQIPIKSRKVAELAIPRFRFMAELVAAAGLQGWVILLDEAELVATFSLQARANSYRTLATLLGLTDEPLPGVFTVATITTDLETEVFHKRQDQDKIPIKFADKLGDIMPDILAGMESLETSSPGRLALEPVSQTTLQDAHGKAQRLYTQAYGWAPPPAAVSQRESSARMRQYVRAWITRWDLMRLFPGYSPDIETANYVPDLSERQGLDRSDEPDQEDIDRE